MIKDNKLSETNSKWRARNMKSMITGSVLWMREFSPTTLFPIINNLSLTKILSILLSQRPSTPLKLQCRDSSMILRRQSRTLSLSSHKKTRRVRTQLFEDSWQLSTISREEKPPLKALLRLLIQSNSITWLRAQGLLRISSVLLIV